MTTRTTLGLTERHRRFLTEKVGQGEFASESAAVEAALDRMIRDEEERDTALRAMTDAIRSRVRTPATSYVEGHDAFAAARARLEAARKG